MGGVNYGPRIGEDKGIIGGASIDGRPLGDWRTTPLRESDLTDLAAGAEGKASIGAIPGLTFAHAEFTVDEPADRFLDTDGWGKGSPGSTDSASAATGRGRPSGRSTFPARCCGTAATSSSCSSSTAPARTSRGSSATRIPVPSSTDEVLFGARHSHSHPYRMILQAAPRPER